MSIADSIREINNSLPDGVKLVAVSKFHPADAIKQAYNAGQRIFGESKVQEMTSKYEVLPKDIEWHFIGHLQTNKVKYIASFVSLIHGVDSYKLLKEIDKQAEKVGRKVKCLLQIHIAQEETKFGFSSEECIDMLENKLHTELNNIEICGLMAMASNTDCVVQIRKEFSGLKCLYDRLKQEYFSNSDSFKELSIGMSGDYEIAIEEGSTLVRIGSKIFGNREY